MRILVIGAAGRLGAAVSDVLLLAGHSVIAPSRADLGHLQCPAGHHGIGPAATGGHRQLQRRTMRSTRPRRTPPRPLLSTLMVLHSWPARPGRLERCWFTTARISCSMETPRQPYAEDEPTNPLSVYGASKLAGENEIRSTRPPLHPSSRKPLRRAPGRKGHQATIDQMTDKLLAGVPLPALADRTVSPSYVADVARATAMLIELNAPHGTYHCVNSGCGNVVRSRERAGPPARRARPCRTRAGGDSEHGRPASAILRAVESQASPGRCGHANLAVGHRPAPAGTPSARSRRRRESLHYLESLTLSIVRVGGIDRVSTTAMTARPRADFCRADGRPYSQRVVRGGREGVQKGSLPPSNRRGTRPIPRFCQAAAPA